jgi:Holliday junction resolvase RusA-like endonuclease
MFWRERLKLKNELLKEIWAETFDKVNHKEITKPRRYQLNIMVYQPTRRFDKDNLYASCKLIIDALRKLSLIYNDSPKWLDLDIQQDLDHDNPRVEIDITELKLKS